MYLTIIMWTVFVSAVSVGIIVASTDVNASPKLRPKKNSTSTPIIFVTPSAIPTKQPEFNELRHGPLNREILSTAASERSDYLPRIAFPPKKQDQIRSNSNSNYRRPSNSAPQHVLASSKDVELSNIEDIQSGSVPATYESIVYNPDTKDASASFSQSNFWESPELIVKDVNQRHEGKNSYSTSSIRTEYTPNYKSIQTPLNQIQYQGHRQPSQTSPTRFQPTERPIVKTSPQVFENHSNVKEDEDEEETQNQEDESEELNEEEDEDEDDRRPSSHFNSFENIQEPDDIYSDVLNNIGSVFSDDHRPAPLQNSHLEERTHVDDLHPQFEEYSFENLQQREREDEEEEAEDKGELAEYEDDDEKEESKQVPLKNVKESPKNRLTVQNHGRPPSPNAVHREDPRLSQKPEKFLQKSPFPNVNIIKDNGKTQKQHNSAPFSPWLRNQGPTPTAKPRPWPHTSQNLNFQAKQQSAPQAVHRAPLNQQRPLKKQESHKKAQNGDIAPYNESYKTSYNKSWKTSSPDKDENSSYRSSWSETTTIKPKHKNYKEGKKYYSSNQDEGNGNSARPRKSTKNVFRQSPSEVKEAIRRSDPLSGKESAQIFVTPVPAKLTQTDSVGTPTIQLTRYLEALGDGAAVDKIDDLYNTQHEKV